MNFSILSCFWVRVTEIFQKNVDSSPQVNFWKMKKYLQAFDRKRVFSQSFIICIPREQVTVVSWDNLVQIHPLPGTITQVPSPNHLNKLSPEYSGGVSFTSLTGKSEFWKLLSRSLHFVGVQISTKTKLGLLIFMRDFISSQVNNANSAIIFLINPWSVRVVRVVPLVIVVQVVQMVPVVQVVRVRVSWF